MAGNDEGSVMVPVEYEGMGTYAGLTMTRYVAIPQHIIDEQEEFVRIYGTLPYISPYARGDEGGRRRSYSEVPSLVEDAGDVESLFTETSSPLPRTASPETDRAASRSEDSPFVVKKGGTPTVVEVGEDISTRKISDDVLHLVAIINSLPLSRTAKYNGLPVRHALTHHPALYNEVSKRSGYLKVKESKLRPYYGDERLFSPRMWWFLDPRGKNPPPDRRRSKIKK
ncbi:hypothetical protein K470DRAFT_256147 [Piedraia hortae CBS 480.64]|uniref:Uncharacterized protein n=1 Tax=Piedraia hortae CBS 480.64 TaxID=1314780 RepID=A0A6A7C3X1_9PEZI|nr:hypothetical protein K470DRAFT_256147 [Piedraia hortae CBS 480.64]